MSPRFEAFLARIYVDAAARQRFLADPLAAARDAGLDAREARALADIDRIGLELAAESFARKRAHGAKRGIRRWLSLVVSFAPRTGAAARAARS